MALAMMMGWMGLHTTALAGTELRIEQAVLSPGVCADFRDGQRVTLPDDWRQHTLKPPAAGCYRAQFRLNDEPDQPWALRLDRLPGNHRVTVNGLPLSTRHMEGSAITSMATLPYLIELPVHTLHQGNNDIEIDVRMNIFRKPGISPMVAGPLSDLRGDFDSWSNMTVDLPQLMNMSVAGMALFILLAWRARPSDVIFAYFGWLMLVMCGRNALYFVETIVCPTSWMDWLFFATHAVTTYYNVMFGLTYANVQVQKLIWPLRAIGFGIPVLGLLVMGTPHMDTLRLVAYPVMMLGGVLVVVKIVQTAWTKHWMEAIAMTLGPVGTLISMGHDYLFLTPVLAVTDLYWTPYFSPIIFLGFALTLMRRFVDAMNLAEKLNVILEERVTQRTHDLELANLSRTRFLAAASHDLRQPTASIGLLANLLQAQAKDPESRRLGGLLQDAVLSMESLLVGLLDVSRLDAGAVQPKLGPVSLNEVFDAVRAHEHTAAEAKGLSLRFRLPRMVPGEHLILQTDSVLLHSVLRNLVTNAIRYTQQGGVLVAARRVGKQRVRIEVWDTGIGIAPDQQARVFEEFYQVGNTARDRTQGIGLGLAIVQRTTALLDEAIVLKSVQGRGSCFAFTLPLSLSQQTIAHWPPTQRAPLGDHLVWLVEDDGLLRESLEASIKSWGVRARSWPDAESLLRDMDLMLSTPGEKGWPDTLVTDYRLPGMDGLELAHSVSQRLAKQAAQCRTLVVSGDTDPSEIARLTASGHALLSKPFHSEDLLALLQGHHAAPTSA